jgi:hypothetical protein
MPFAFNTAAQDSENINLSTDDGCSHDNDVYVYYIRVPYSIVDGTKCIWILLYLLLLCVYRYVYACGIRVCRSFGALLCVQKPRDAFTNISVVYIPTDCVSHKSLMN